MAWGHDTQIPRRFMEIRKACAHTTRTNYDHATIILSFRIVLFCFTELLYLKLGIYLFLHSNKWWNFFQGFSDPRKLIMEFHENFQQKDCFVKGPKFTKPKKTSLKYHLHKQCDLTSWQKIKMMWRGVLPHFNTFLKETFSRVLGYTCQMALDWEKSTMPTFKHPNTRSEIFFLHFQNFSNWQASSNQTAKLKI